MQHVFFVVKADCSKDSLWSLQSLSHISCIQVHPNGLWRPPGPVSVGDECGHDLVSPQAESSPDLQDLAVLRKHSEKLLNKVQKVDFTSRRANHNVHLVGTTCSESCALLKLSEDPAVSCFMFLSFEPPPLGVSSIWTQLVERISNLKWQSNLSCPLADEIKCASSSESHVLSRILA